MTASRVGGGGGGVPQFADPVLPAPSKPSLAAAPLFLGLGRVGGWVTVGGRARNFGTKHHFFFCLSRVTEGAPSVRRTYVHKAGQRVKDWPRSRPRPERPIAPQKTVCVSAAYPQGSGSRNCTQGTKQGCVGRAEGPQRRPQGRLGRRLEGVAGAVGGGYCRLQMPSSLSGYGGGGGEGPSPTPCPSPDRTEHHFFCSKTVPKSCMLLSKNGGQRFLLTRPRRAFPPQPPAEEGVQAGRLLQFSIHRDFPGGGDARSQQIFPGRRKRRTRRRASDGSRSGQTNQGQWHTWTCGHKYSTKNWGRP